MISELLLLDAVNFFGPVLLREVDLGPVGSSLGVSTWFVFSHSFPAVFLLVALNFAK